MFSTRTASSSSSAGSSPSQSCAACTISWRRDATGSRITCPAGSSPQPGSSSERSSGFHVIVPLCRPGRTGCGWRSCPCRSRSALSCSARARAAGRGSARTRHRGRRCVECGRARRRSGPHPRHGGRGRASRVRPPRPPEGRARPPLGGNPLLSSPDRVPTGRGSRRRCPALSRMGRAGETSRRCNLLPHLPIAWQLWCTD